MIYGENAIIEIEGDRVLMTDRAGSTQDLSAPDLPDDSYHSAWFAGVAGEFERAITAGPGSHLALENLAEARFALALTIAARRSAEQGGIDVALA